MFNDTVEGGHGMRGREIYMSADTFELFEELKRKTGKSGAQLVAEGLRLVAKITQQGKQSKPA